MRTRNWNRPLISLITSCLPIVPMLASAASDNATLSVAHGFVLLPPSNRCVLAGYGYLYGTYGSYSPTGLTGGDAVFRIDDEYTCPGTTYLESTLEVQFSSNPGSSWLTSITCNGIEKTGGTATYGFADNIGFWSWTNSFGLSGKSGSDVGCTIVHN